MAQLTETDRLARPLKAASNAGFSTSGISGAASNKSTATELQIPRILALAR